MKATTKQRGVQTGPDLAALIGDRKVVDLASRSRVGMATWYRALRGSMPHDPNVLAMAAELGVSESVLRAAIQRSAKGAA